MWFSMKHKILMNLIQHTMNNTPLNSDATSNRSRLDPILYELQMNLLQYSEKTSDLNITH